MQNIENGELKNVRLKFIDEFAKFSDLDYFEEYNEIDEDITSMISLSSKMNQDKEDDPF